MVGSGTRCLRVPIVGFHDTSIPFRMEKAKPLALNIKTPGRLVILYCLWATLAALSACSSQPPEAALRAQLLEMQEAAGQQRIGDFMQGVADDFTGNEGMDRAALHNLLRLQVLGKTSVGINTGPVQVQVTGETATVKFDVLLVGSSKRLLPDSARSYSVTSGWRMEDDQWRVYYAQWQSSL